MARPKTGNARKHFAFRMSPAGIAAVDALAAELGVTRSETLRVLVAWAIANAPRPALRRQLEK